jgi:hypothetical protein
MAIPCASSTLSSSNVTKKRETKIGKEIKGMRVSVRRGYSSCLVKERGHSLRGLSIALGFMLDKSKREREKDSSMNNKFLSCWRGE